MNYKGAVFNTPSNTPNYSNYGEQSIFSKLGGWINKNPEKFAITADMIGSQLAGPPHNPFAGVGTMLGKSSLADKATKETQSKEAQLMKLIKALTGKGMEGGNDLKLSMGDDGLLNVTSSSSIKPSALAGETKPADDPHSFLRSIAVPD